jgi:hypothetical protein
MASHGDGMDYSNVDYVAATQDVAAAADHQGLRSDNGGENQPYRNKRPALSGAAGPGSSGVGNGSSNTSNKFLPSLTDSIYTDIEASAAAEVQPAVSAVIKVDQKVVKAEKHLHRLQQQLESGDITFTFLKVGKPVLQYNCAEAQADADAAWREYQQKLLAAAIKGAEADLAAVKQEQLSIKVSATLQMQQNSFDKLPDSWAADPVVQKIKQQQQQLFEWELGKAKGNLAQAEKQLAEKEAKKAAAAAAAGVEGQPTTLAEQVEDLVAKSVPKVLPKVLAKQATAKQSGSSTGKDTGGGNSKGKGGKQQQQTKQGESSAAAAAAPPNPASKTYRGAAAGSNRGRSRSRSRFYPNRGKGGGGGGNQDRQGSHKQQQQQHQPAAA